LGIGAVSAPILAFFYPKKLEEMTIQELGTAAQDNTSVKIAIINNGFLGMVRQWQELFYKKNYVATPLSNPTSSK
jgi:thiamine pyrophosphate-dependent acetolactate synthase large subunit-like protein